MEMKDFYYFESRYLFNSFQVESILSGRDDNKLIKAYYKEINFPVIFKQVSGKKFTDILTTGWVSLFLISDNVKTLLKENDFTGWKTYPIILEDKKRIR